nr:Uncharacterised protein [Klebsiella pneumoniae]
MTPALTQVQNGHGWMYETARLRHEVYMTGIIGQQLAKFHHINIFNIANLLRINCNRSFRLFIVLKPWISAETGISCSRNKCFDGRLFYFAVVSPTLPREVKCCIQRSNVMRIKAMTTSVTMNKMTLPFLHKLPY